MATASAELNLRRSDGPELGLPAVLKALIGNGLITEEQARYLQRLPISMERGQHPLEIVARQKWRTASPPHAKLDLERLCRWLAAKVGLPYARIDPLKIDVNTVAGVVSYPYATRFQILPMAITDESIMIATAQPYQQEWEDELTRLLRRRIERVIANPRDIRRYLREFYKVGRAIREATNEGQLSRLSSVLNLEQLVELGRADQLDANDRHIVNIVDWLLQYAFEQRASDLHLEPRRDSGRIRLRIDGVLHIVQEMPPVVLAAVTSRLKSLGRMDLIEKRRPQDGRIKTKTPNGQEIELRLSTMPTAFGEKLVMRVFDPEVLKRSFGELGFPQHDMQRWEWMLSQPNGMILVTGPTGSGKTTTLYSALRRLAKPEVNVCTIEDPIEMVEPDFNQMQVQHNIGVDFAAGVRNLLRQDPDIIMVGEVRDLETAEMAIQASLTGHLILSTLHTNDAPSAITRLLEIGVPPYLLKDTLLGVVAQRLVRTLCPACKKPITAEEVEWGDLEPPKVDPAAVKYFHPAGCEECRQTGFRGRVGIYETFTITSTLQEFITEDTDLSTLRAQAIKEGMRSLRTAGVLKVASGVTTTEEVRRVVTTYVRDD